MPDSLMSSNVCYKKTTAHPTCHTNARFMDVKQCILQKNCCTPNPSHQCQIPGYQMSSDVFYPLEKLLHTQPIAPMPVSWMSSDVWYYSLLLQKNCCAPNPLHQCQMPGWMLSNVFYKTKNAAHPTRHTKCFNLFKSALLHTPIRCTNAWFLDTSNVFYRMRETEWMSWSNVFCKNIIFFTDIKDLRLPVEHSAV